MDGEIEAVSSWTVDTLAIHLQSQINDMKTSVAVAFASQQTAMQTAFTAADKAVDKALAAAEKAVDVQTRSLDSEFHEHLEQVRHENKLALDNVRENAAAALAAQKEAVNKAETASEKRFESVNEFRAQLNDQQRTFIPRQEEAANRHAQDAKIQALTDVVDKLEKRVDLREGKSLGTTAAVAGAVTIITIVVILVNVGLSLIK